MKHLERKGAYSRFRFDWKRELNASSSLSRGAKQLATCLCDTYVNKHTGLCWPKNETLARKQNLSKRSIQRQLKELQSAGWLIYVNLKGTRRAFRISIPTTHEGDIDDDTLSPLDTSNSSPDNDISVTPNKNQGKNKKRAIFSLKAVPLIEISRDEEVAISNWNDFLLKNTKHGGSRVLDLLRTNRGYMFPARYPKEEDAEYYRSFFDKVIASKGSIIP